MKTGKEVRELQQELFYQAFPDVDDRVQSTLQDISEALDAITDYSIHTVTITLDVYRDDDGNPVAAANKKFMSRVAKEVADKGFTMFPKGDDELIISW